MTYDISGYKLIRLRKALKCEVFPVSLCRALIFRDLNSLKLATTIEPCLKANYFSAILGCTPLATQKHLQILPSLKKCNSDF